MNRISVLIPFYEKQKTLLKVLDELTLQIYPQDEILIIDDHSPKGVPKCDCPNVRVIRPPKQEPHIWRLNTLRNYGIRKAKSDRILILDPDCIPDINLLQNAREMFHESTLYGGRIDLVQEDGSIKEDPRIYSGRGDIYGGCMLFSKSRTALVGWFSEEYNGAWGLGEIDFSHKCYQSGMITGFTQKLHVIHQHHVGWHEGHERNQQLFAKKRTQYMKNLSSVTPYKPRVAVCVLSLMRPYYLKECLRSIAAVRIPIRLFLVNQGDTGDAQMKIVNQWKNKWNTTYIFNDPPKWPGPSRAEIFILAKEMGFQYLVTVDDDCFLHPHAVENLVKAADRNPEFHGISGYLRFSSKKTSRTKYMLGGEKEIREGKLYFKPFPWRKGVHEAEYICNGLRLVRLDPLVTPDPEWTMGMTDYDWSMQVKKEGLRLAVCGEAGAFHKYQRVGARMKNRRNPYKYDELYRRNEVEIARMADRFKMKWGLELGFE